MHYHLKLMKLSGLTTVLFLNFACISLLFSPETLFAQQSESDQIQIRVTARVVKTMEMITVRDMQFGQVQPGQEEIYIDPLNDTETGKMIATGTPDAQIRISFLPQRQLNRDNGSGTLMFYYEVAGNDEDDQASAELLQPDNRNLTLNSEGRYYLWIGGRVDVRNALPGNYNGEFTIEVEYI